jgi:signal transduction histidine kinase
MKFSSKIIAGFGTALAILLCVGILSYSSLIRDDEDRAWVLHTHTVLSTLDGVLQDLIDAETGERGFIVAGEEIYLQPYRESAERIQRHLRDLGELTRDNPAQQRALERLKPAVEAKLKELQEQIQMRRQSPAAATEIIRAGVGKQTMDQLRLQISQMKKVEEGLREERMAAADASSRRTRWLILVGTGLALFFLAFAAVVVRQEMNQRKHAESVVRELNLTLERRVEERTAELKEREQDLSRSNAELQQFAYVASHDLQEPLRMVASFTQLLARRYSDKLDKDARDFIDYAVDGATRMQTLISDLLNYSRVGTQGKPFESTDCNTVLDQVLRSLRLAIEETHAVITRDRLPVVLGDRVQLGQLLQNLLTNAIKFHGPDVPRVHVSAERNGANWNISVRDNGIGIPAEHVDRIFIIFQRLHTKAEYPGTGIGLAMCKKIVERHGGRIWPEPASGGGTTFCFTIPATAALVAMEKDKGDHVIRAVR